MSSRASLGPSPVAGICGHGLFRPSAPHRLAKGRVGFIVRAEGEEPSLSAKPTLVARPTVAARPLLGAGRGERGGRWGGRGPAPPRELNSEGEPVQARQGLPEAAPPPTREDVSVGGPPRGRDVSLFERGGGGGRSSQQQSDGEQAWKPQSVLSTLGKGVAHPSAAV